MSKRLLFISSRSGLSLFAVAILLGSSLQVSAHPTSELFHAETPSIDGPATDGSKLTILKASAAYSELSDYGIEAIEQQKKARTQFLVRSVKPFSRAESWGVTQGDLIVSVLPAPGGPALVIERAGKQFSIDLAQERQYGAAEQEPSSAKQPEERKLNKEQNKMEGTFRGDCEGSGEIATEIHSNSDGVPYGTYSQSGYTGTLDTGTVTGDHTLSFIWHDKYGHGPVTFVFNYDNNSFVGTWAGILHWTGNRQ